MIMPDIKLLQGDCLDLMPTIEDNSIDCIICDLPYGVTQNKWDSIINLDSLWEQYKRIIKDNGAIILFGQDKFTMKVMLSNEKWHRYNLIWNKENSTGFLNANKMPLRVHEDIIVFYKKLPTYNPQKVEGKAPSHRQTKKGNLKKEMPSINSNYGDFYKGNSNNDILQSNMKYPTSILTFKRVPVSKCVHPTQKPIELLEWLIKTYSNEGDTILDNCMGSGTTGVACKLLNRNFIGIEKEEQYYDIAKNRIHNSNFNHITYQKETNDNKNKLF